MLEEKQLVIIHLKPTQLWFLIKWPKDKKKGGDLIQGSRDAIKMLTILTFKLIG